MILHQRFFQYVFPWLAALTVASTTSAATVIIDQDTTIDAQNSFPDDRLRIVDGISDPIEVSMLAGGTVGLHVSVEQNSRFEMFGGFIGDRVSVIENGTFVYRGGNISSINDVNGNLGASGNSTLHIFGALDVGALILNEFSTVHFYGSNLQFFNGKVTGLAATGDPQDVNLIIGSSDVQVVLHGVPEPSTLICGASALGILLGFRRLSRQPLLRE